ncbi:arsenate respiratory reductase iron-sulfur subunit ArrB [Shewanella waksmanii]|uniref:arsenate respiratory reductase iron-sulfur subunit ArrB n=1 Tax=Shewanella waksmanii TaxID=213783 RepID=UPI003736D016
MRLGMVIDLQKCVGCGGCDLACKTENNTPDGVKWSNHINVTEGRFPDVKYSYVPTLCNHCSDAACVKVCPTGAMYKDERGLTLQDNDKCIGCMKCQRACPYGVISYNRQVPHREWQDDSELVAKGTASPHLLLKQTGSKSTPYVNPERGDTYPETRPRRTTEKCTLCDHRLDHGLQPACVSACPSGARVVGDFDDPSSEVSRLISMHGGKQMNVEAGTKPNVYYIRSFNVKTIY